MGCSPLFILKCRFTDAVRGRGTTNDRLIFSMIGLEVRAALVIRSRFVINVVFDHPILLLHMFS